MSVRGPEVSNHAWEGFRRIYVLCIGHFPTWIPLPFKLAFKLIYTHIFVVNQTCRISNRAAESAMYFNAITRTSVFQKI
jgi:hypothetical protein